VPADVSDAYRAVLVDPRAALIAFEEGRIEKLDKPLQDLQKAEEPELDDQIAITDELKPNKKMTVQHLATRFPPQEHARRRLRPVAVWAWGRKKVTENDRELVAKAC
jgi:hypothetical protein